jgi:crossover junction endodeoxyribonuclease RusA
MRDLVIPYPPSANKIWRRVGPRTLLSRAGRLYRRDVHAALLAQGSPHVRGRLAVFIRLHPPDRRRRDIDNTIKPLLDALQHGGLFNDDSQIDLLLIVRDACTPGGLARVRCERVDLQGELFDLESF